MNIDLNLGWLISTLNNEYNTLNSTIRVLFTHHDDFDNNLEIGRYPHPLIVQRYYRYEGLSTNSRDILRENKDEILRLFKIQEFEQLARALIDIGLEYTVDIPERDNYPESLGRVKYNIVLHTQELHEAGSTIYLIAHENVISEEGLDEEDDSDYYPLLIQDGSYLQDFPLNSSVLLIRPSGNLGYWNIYCTTSQERFENRGMETYSIIEFTLERRNEFEFDQACIRRLNF
ncbi:MAG: hypothetical protein ACTSQI_16610 [Candidatus Helarchaeota archaeon]